MKANIKEVANFHLLFNAEEIMKIGTLLKSMSKVLALILGIPITPPNFVEFHLFLN